MRVVIVGAGIAGLHAAMAFRARGWDVTLLEAEARDEPATDQDGWFRGGTPHAKQAHAFLGGFLEVTGRAAPDLFAAIASSGVMDLPIERLVPPTVDLGEPQPGDELLRVMGARRPHVEWQLRRFVLSDAEIAWRSGAPVRGLIARGGNGAAPRAAGVILDDGERIHADEVIDASGRGSRAATWLRDIGVTLPPAIEEPCGAAYRTRYYRFRDPAERPYPPWGHVVAAPHPTFVMLMFPGENGILQFALGLPPGDPLFARAHESAVFHAIVTSSPVMQPWLDPDRTEPLTEVGVYGKLDNRLQPLVMDGEPVATGFHFVGDSGAITNPMHGRGVSHAAIHAHAVASILTTTDEPRARSLAVHAEVERMIAPSVRDSIALDRVRAAAWAAVRAGEPPPPPAMPGLPEDVSVGRYAAASTTHPEGWRIVARCAQVLDPPGTWRSDERMIELMRSIEPIDIPVPSAEEARAAMARVEAAIASVV